MVVVCVRVKSIWEDSFVPLSIPQKKPAVFWAPRGGGGQLVSVVHTHGKRGLNRQDLPPELMTLQKTFLPFMQADPEDSRNHKGWWTGQETLIVKKQGGPILTGKVFWVLTCGMSEPDLASEAGQIQPTALPCGRHNNVLLNRAAWVEHTTSFRKSHVQSYSLAGVEQIICFQFAP